MLFDDRNLVTTLLVVALAGCGGEPPPPPAATPEPAAAVATANAEEVFSERSGETGFTFVHFNGMSGEYYYNEMLGSGAAAFDYDNDGDLDLYIAQGSMLGQGKTLDDAVFPPRHPLPLTDRLYRNDLTVAADGSRTLRFTDVTEASGLQTTAYGMGAAAADYDNDGWVDLYVANYGSNQLLRNRGDGTFEDVTAETGTGDPRWSIPVAFFDYDRDGWLDLYVANYTDYREEIAKICRLDTGARTYCGPLSYDPQPDSLFRNRGRGADGTVTFEDVSEAAGIRREYGGALGVKSADLDGDGWLDLYVANDGLPNQMWINQRDGTFDNRALHAGAAVDRQGDAEASMGVDVADFDGDGDEDIFLTHINRETNTIYINDGHGFFEDASIQTGLGPASWDFTGFGTAWVDYDGDGWLDILAVNGAVLDLEPLRRAGDPYPYHQTNQLFHNLGSGAGAAVRFEEVTAAAGPVFELSEVSRGAAFGDLDNDGDMDVILVNNNGPARLLINNVGNRNHWLGLRLLGEEVARDMLGARVGVFLKSGRVLWRRSRTDGSYASSNDPRVLVGLGDEAAIARVEVGWPDGRREEWTSVPADRYTTLRQGSGASLEPGS